RVAVVTGGASGLGAGLSRRFSAEGMTVVVADILEDAGMTLQRELGQACLFLKTDLRSDEDIDRLVAQLDDRFGHVDFLLNVACSYDEGGLHSTRQQWRAVFDINLFGHAMLIQKCLPLLKRSTGPSIVN